MAPGPKKRNQARGVARSQRRRGIGDPRLCLGGLALGQAAAGGCVRFRMSPAPVPHDGVNHSRVKQRTSIAYREQGPHAVKPGCYIKEHR